MKYNIKQSLKFSLPVFILITVFFTLAGSLLLGIFLGLFIGGFIALMVAFIYSKSLKESVADFRLDKEKRSRLGLNLRKLIPTYFIILIGAILTRYTGKIYLMLILSVALSTAAAFILSIKSDEYIKAKAEGDLTAFYALIITLPIPLISIYVLFLLLVYGGNVQEIFKLL